MLVTEAEMRVSAVLNQTLANLSLQPLGLRIYILFYINGILQEQTFPRLSRMALHSVHRMNGRAFSLFLVVLPFPEH